MTNKQKANILLRFFIKWVMPRVILLVMALFVVWCAVSTIEIAMADCTEIGRDYWDYNIFTILMDKYA